MNPSRDIKNRNHLVCTYAHTTLAVLKIRGNPDMPKRTTNPKVTLAHNIQCSMTSSSENQEKLVVQGTCGWTDESIAACGRVYPRGVKGAAERLPVYSKIFGCVEIDTSTYAIPRVNRINSWLKTVTPGFVFHIKAFGLFCNRQIQTGALPRMNCISTNSQVLICFRRYS